jgi:hypothetical protein
MRVAHDLDHLEEIATIIPRTLAARQDMYAQRENVPPRMGPFAFKQATDGSNMISLMNGVECIKSIAPNGSLVMNGFAITLFTKNLKGSPECTAAEPRTAFISSFKSP